MDWRRACRGRGTLKGERAVPGVECAGQRGWSSQCSTRGNRANALRTQDPTFAAVVEEKATLLSSLPQEDLYLKLKKLEQHLDFLALQEEYIKDEQKNLKRELIRAQEEVKRIQSVPLVIGQFLEPIDQHTGIVGSTTGSNYVVRILSTIDRELLKPSSSVALHRHSNSLVDVLPPEADSSISMLGADEKPDV